MRLVDDKLNSLHNSLPDNKDHPRQEAKQEGQDGPNNREKKNCRGGRGPKYYTSSCSSVTWKPQKMREKRGE